MTEESPSQKVIYYRIPFTYNFLNDSILEMENRLVVAKGKGPGEVGWWVEAATGRWVGL